MSKRKDGFTFWRRIRFKYKISAFNENTLEEVWGIRLSKLTAAAVLSVFAIVIIFVTSLIIIKTPIRNYLPGYLNSELREGIIHNALMLDSLEQVSALQSDFITHVGSILRGDVVLDSVRQIDSLVWMDVLSVSKTEQESLFVARFEEEEHYNLSVLPSVQAADELMLVFAKPVNGDIVEAFTEMSGIGIAVTSEQPVLASLHGTVVYSGYNVDDRYVIQIQHERGFLTTYRQVSNPLKQVGDKVNAGQAIAVMRGGTVNVPVVLRFDLWQNGECLNPTEYIVF